MRHAGRIFGHSPNQSKFFSHHTPPVSSRVSKTATIAVLAAMIMVPAARITALSAGSHLRLASCHHQRSKAPAPMPANFSCCLSGHNSAIVPAHLSIQAAATTLALILPDSSLFVTASGTILQNLICSSDDPPVKLPFFFQAEDGIRDIHSEIFLGACGQLRDKRAIPESNPAK